jgi:uncharacterized protein (DUF1015 family)
MADIRPFRAYRYDPARVELSRVLTQPYDKISPEMQERYFAASPYNLISVEKGLTFEGDTPESNVYTRAEKKLEDWIAEAVLVQDAAPAIYVYSQEYVVPGTSTSRTRTGLIALGRIEDYDAAVVFRHERTLAAPKADRLELLRRTQTQTGQLFMLYDDASGKVESAIRKATAAAPAAEMRDEYGVVHRLWPVMDDASIQQLTIALADKKLVIADGHHRYETALNFRNENRAKNGLNGNQRNEPYEFAMMTLFNTRSEGLTILPTHRVVRNVKSFSFERLRECASQYFDWYGYPFASAAERSATFQRFRGDLENRGRSAHAIGVYAGHSAFYLFILKKDADLEELIPDVPASVRVLDVFLLHRLLFEKCLDISADAVAGEKNITYEREMDTAIAEVDRNGAQLVCLLNPVQVEQVTEIALGGDVLPQKSTDFYPKLLSGIANYRY